MPSFNGIQLSGFWIMLMLILIRYLVIAFLLFFVFYYVKKKRWAFKKIQLKFPRMNDYAREISYSILTSFIFAGIGYILFFTPIKKFTYLYTSIIDFGWTYFFVSILLMLLIHDTYFYWTHRAMHHPRIFKWFHQVHHQSMNPSPWAAYSFHPLEAVVEASIVIVLAFLMPVHPLSISLFLFIMMIYNVYGHLGYEIYPSGFSNSIIGKWINTSLSHNQHHQFFDGNYGLYFLWWDRWMGTLRSDYTSQFEKVKSRVP